MKKRILFTLIIITCLISLRAQTITGTITTQPCNNNGVCAVSVIGLSMPITYTYWNGYTQVIHSNVNSLSDQFIGFSSYGSGYVYVEATDGINSVANSFNYVVPFHVSANNVNPICPNTTGTLTANTYSGTTGPFSYTWTNLVTNATYTGNIALVPVGQYSLVVVDQITGCRNELADSSIYVSQTSNINITYSTTIANCTNGTASVSVSGGVGPYTYQWNTGANTPSINNLTQGAYSATVTDSQGCINNNVWSTAWVQQTPTISVNPSVTNATCVQNNGSAIAFATGGMPPYTYAWDNGQTTQTLTAVAGGTYYTVIATDANGCTGSVWVTIGVTTPITVTDAVSASSCSAPTGSATLNISGGTPPYTTVWNTFSGLTTNTTISGVTSGQYAFTVTDAIGCIQTGSVFIPSISNIYGGIYSSIVTCPASAGAVYSNVSGTNPPFTYNWSNGSTATQISNVPLGSYSCIITDAVGCSVTKYASLYAISPINIGLTATQASCKFTADGSVIANATGGTAPYTYNWSNGQTGTTASSLPYGNIFVSVTDANGCSNNNHTYVNYNAANNSCYCTITGKVYKDVNSNCVMDGGETGIHNIMIHCSGMGYAFTDVNGDYSFQVPTGTYTLTESVNSTYPLATCQNNGLVQTVVASPGCVSTIDFANNIVLLHDLHIITTSYFAPIPGNAYYQKVIIENNGTIQESGIQIGYKTDGQLGTFTDSPVLFTQNDAVNYPNNFSVNTGFTSLFPGAFDEIVLTYNIPTNIPLGTLVNFYDSTAHAAPINTVWLTDQTPWNNVENYQQTVISSFDPNFKEVSPKGNGPQGYIASKDSILSYVIHFQNEGTYFAQNISVVDTLDSDLDWSTLHPGYSDHSYTTSVSENGVITFRFTNINLPWKSQYGDLMSSGMIAYTVKRKRNLPQGTQFKNTAAIYFDYNAPVITNTTVNTLNDALASVDEKVLLDDNDISLYPNPANNSLNIEIDIKTENMKAQLNMIDINGQVLCKREISLEVGKNIVSHDTNELTSGIYFVQVKFNESIITKKLVIIK